MIVEVAFSASPDSANTRVTQLTFLSNLSRLIDCSLTN